MRKKLQGFILSCESGVCLGFGGGGSLFASRGAEIFLLPLTWAPDFFITLLRGGPSWQGLCRRLDVPDITVPSGA